MLAILATWLICKRRWLVITLTAPQVRASPVLPLALGAGLYFAIALAALVAQASVLGPLGPGAPSVLTADFTMQARVLLGTYLVATPLALVAWWWIIRRPLTLDGLGNPPTPTTLGGGRSPTREPRGPLVGLLVGLVGALIAAPVVIAAGQLAGLLAQLMGSPPPPSLAHTTLVGLADPAQPLAWRGAVILAVVLCVPIVEEVLYRGLLQTACARGLVALGLTREASPSAWPAIVLSSLIFVIAHAGAVPQDAWAAAGATLLALSLTLGVAFARTGSIVAPIVVHVLFNAANVTAALAVA